MPEVVTSVLKLGNLHVMVWLHTDVNPSSSEWDGAIEALLEAKRRGGAANIRNFVVTDGGAPNAAQRSAMHRDVFDGRPSKLAVVTNSLSNPLKRGVATALAWLNPAFLAVEPDRWREALRHVDLEPHLRAIVTELERLQRELRPVTTLTQLVLEAKRAEKPE